MRRVDDGAQVSDEALKEADADKLGESNRELKAVADRFGIKLW